MDSYIMSQITDLEQSNEETLQNIEEALKQLMKATDCLIKCKAIASVNRITLNLLRQYYED